MMRPLDNQVAIVTGGSRGIGRAIAVRLAASGARVVLNYARNLEAAEEVLALIDAEGGEGVLVQGDVADPATAEALIKTALVLHHRQIPAQLVIEWPRHPHRHVGIQRRGEPREQHRPAHRVPERQSEANRAVQPPLPQPLPDPAHSTLPPS